MAAAPVLLSPLPAQAQSGAGAAEAAEHATRELQEAIEALSEAEAARDRVAALSRTIAAYEEGLAALRDGLRRAAIRETAIRRQFDARSADLSQLLGVLATVERTDGPLLLLHPSGPLGTARSGMMLAEVAPALAAEATAIRANLEEIAMIRALQESAAHTLEAGLVQVQQARVALAQAIADRRDLPQRIVDDPEALRALLDSADTLDSFASGLAGIALPGDEGAPGDTTSTAAFEAARGTLPLPVQGTVLRRAGEADAAGIRRPGLLLATRPRALVTAPSAATIRYRGPLLDYGNVMILEPAEGYLLVIAGLDIVYGDVGEVVPEGTPLGLMGGQEPGAEEFLVLARQGSGDRTETLYIELRQGAEPLDPAAWFAQTRE
ncbi:peptidoglycan DD-metalloendopeptidase family protein [Alkalilacustris brevis]|uniref:murein hydrolase activator EnvC family protein n=1 Tax=Alkalilacustris brevis TaxID=2026338 RepID=UPI000E0D782E